MCVSEWKWLDTVSLVQNWLVSRGMWAVCNSTCQLPLPCQNGSPTLVRVLNDNRVDGCQFIVCRTFPEKIILQRFQEAHEAVFGGLEVTSMVDCPILRRCVVAGHVTFHDLRGVVSELLPI